MSPEPREPFPEAKVQLAALAVPVGVTIASLAVMAIGMETCESDGFECIGWLFVPFLVAAVSFPGTVIGLITPPLVIVGAVASVLGWMALGRWVAARMASRDGRFVWRRFWARIVGVGVAWYLLVVLGTVVWVSVR